MESLENAHKSACDFILETISKNIIEDEQVMKLTDLRNLYVSELNKTEFSNDDYRGEKLKSKLEKHDFLSKMISFVKLEESTKWQTYLVFSNKMDLSKAVQYSYTLGKRDTKVDVANYLRTQVLDAFSTTESSQWPPDSSYMKKTDMIPQELLHFLTVIISGKSGEATAKVNVLVSSIGQDICRGATNGIWKLPKHIGLCVSLRHLFRSKEPCMVTQGTKALTH